MSTIYHGVTDALIIAPGEQITTANSGLTTLTRTYQCAATYDATAESILVPGYAPADYPLLALQTAPVAQRTGSVTTFACTFYGVLSTDAYNRYYDTYSTRAENASYTLEDYVGQANSNGASGFSLPETYSWIANDASLRWQIIQRSGRFGYGAPVLSRSFVVPKSEKPVAPKLDAAAWSGFPVSTFSEVPPLSTVPTLASSQYDVLQAQAVDLLSFGGYTTQVNSFSVTPYGSVNLVQVEYERVWKGQGKTFNPLAHDPTALRLSETDPVIIPGFNNTLGSAGNATVTGFSVDVLSNGATVTFSGVLNGDIWPVIGTAVWWKSNTVSTLHGGLNSDGNADLITGTFSNQAPGSYTFTLEGAGSDYTYGVNVRKESGYVALGDQPTLS
jgi:hypothetical protein